MESLLANALKSRISGESEKLQAEATKQFNAAQDSVKQQLQVKATALQDSVKKELGKQANASKDKAVEEAKKLLKGFFPKTPATNPDTVGVKNNQ